MRAWPQNYFVALEPDSQNGKFRAEVWIHSRRGGPPGKMRPASEVERLEILDSEYGARLLALEDAATTALTKEKK